jgi:hypothetical protein
LSKDYSGVFGFHEIWYEASSSSGEGELKDRPMQRNLRLLCLAAPLLCVGCNSRPVAVGLQGEVSYLGRAIEKGQIDFVPVENTPGASDCAVIAQGRYNLEAKAKGGLRPDGVYQVRIVAYRKTGKKERVRSIDDSSPGGRLVEVEENFIPAIYNDESTLKLSVADLPDKNKADFQLGKSPTGAPR